MGSISRSSTRREKLKDCKRESRKGSGSALVLSYMPRVILITTLRSERNFPASQIVPRFLEFFFFLPSSVGVVVNFLHCT